MWTPQSSLYIWIDITCYASICYRLVYIISSLLLILDSWPLVFYILSFLFIFLTSFSRVDIIPLILKRIRKMKDIVGNPLRLKSVNHISLICKSVNESVAFYEKVLGFISIVRPGSFDFEGAWYVISYLIPHINEACIMKI